MNEDLKEEMANLFAKIMGPMIAAAAQSLEPEVVESGLGHFPDKASDVVQEAWVGDFLAEVAAAPEPKPKPWLDSLDELLSIEPMMGPAAQVFYMDYVRNNNVDYDEYADEERDHNCDG